MMQYKNKQGLDAINGSNDAHPVLDVVKISGKIIQDEETLDKTLSAFAALPTRKILVHGGGADITRRLDERGICNKVHNGLRITTKETMRVVAEVAEELNEKIAAALCLLGQTGDAIVFSQRQLGPVVYVKKMPRATDGTNYGYVGQTCQDSVDVDLLREVLEKSGIPVISNVARGYSFKAEYNTNADHITMAIAEAMTPYYAVNVHMLSDVDGVRRADGGVIRHIDAAAYASLRGTVVRDGMIVKLDSAFKSINSGICKITIGSAIMRGGTVITR